MLLHDSVWTLPDTPRTREQLVWLAAEITEMGGEAFLWHGVLLVPSEAAALQHQFAATVEMEYQQVLEALTLPGADLRALSDRYARARRRDYFHSPLGPVVRDRLLHYGEEGL